MNLNTSRVRKEEYIYNNPYTTKPIIEQNSVIEGDFYQQKPMTVRAMVTRKINKSLCFCLILALCVTFVSYYIAMNYEAKLNNLDNEIVRLNTENQDLQTELDRYKSFNNVDTKVGEYNLLKKAEKVIEITALKATVKEQQKPIKTASNSSVWAIGY